MGLLPSDINSHKPKEEKRSSSDSRSLEQLEQANQRTGLKTQNKIRVSSDGEAYPKVKFGNGRKLHPMNSLFDGFPSETNIQKYRARQGIREKNVDNADEAVTEKHDISKLDDFSFSTANESVLQFRGPATKEEPPQEQPDRRQYIEEVTTGKADVEASPFQPLSDSSGKVSSILDVYQSNNSLSNTSLKPEERDKISPDTINQDEEGQKTQLRKINSANVIGAGQISTYLSGSKYHNRNGSESSTISNASSNSTIASSKGKRFVRYAMSSHSQSTNLTKKWEISNVIRWLESNKFNNSWKEAFKKNEISGNRFLELCNYDVDSVVWKQFSKYLNLNDEFNSIERFIELLSLDLSKEIEEETMGSFKFSGNHSKNGSIDSQSSNHIKHQKSIIESRKQTSQSKHKAPFTSTSSKSTASPLYQATTQKPHQYKPRPVSYIDVGQKPSKDQQAHNIFFRKHKKYPSDDSTKGSSAFSSPSNNASSKDSSLNTGTNLEPVLKSDANTSEDFNTSKERLQSLSHTDSETNNSMRKSGIFTTLRKYGGEKAAVLVKQVQASNRNRLSFYGDAQRESQAAPPSAKDDENLAPENSNSSDVDDFINSINNLKTEKPARSKSGKYKQLNIMDSPNLGLKLASIDEKYLPKSVGTEGAFILATKDNESFIPIKIKDPKDVSNFKSYVMRKLGLIQIGKISFHLTDFNKKEGSALPDEVISNLISSKSIFKIYVSQDLRSNNETATFSTFSTNSSDSKSFEIKGEDDEKVYPATPQYLLQSSKEKGVDYLNFKDTKTSERSSVPTRKPPDYADFPFTLTLPHKKQSSHKERTPILRITTNSDESISTKENSVNEGSGSFRVLRKSKKEIDFNERRNSPFESKTPKLISNIYQSSVSGSKSPVSATTVSMSKGSTVEDNANIDEHATIRPSDDTETSLERIRSASIAAKRIAPPPPLHGKPSIVRSSSIQRKKSVNDSLKNTPLSLVGRNKPSSRSLRGSISSSSMVHSSNFNQEQSAFKESTISFEDVPDVDIVSISDDEDFFVKSVPKSINSSSEFSFNTKNATKLSLSKEDEGLNQMNVRPPIDDLYMNLEKYFPNTNLDKPIIEVPYSIAKSISKLNNSEENSFIKPTVSRTFSNANSSPVDSQEDSGDVILYPEDQGGNLSRRRMKTIRVVANEARKKRLANRKLPVHSDKASDIPAKQIQTGSLERTNTKFWGQRVIEVTQDEIEKGFTSMLKFKNGEFKEFAWIKGRLIGRGSFGSVYLALNVTTGEMLAVKQVVVPVGYKEGNKLSEGIEALHKEVETMKDLDHNNIVQYLGFEKHDKTYTLFLEYVAGGSISSCMKSFGKIDEPSIKFITYQVLSGLEYLHSNGILHRDLKADNLLLEINGTCKISDFGISKRSKDIYVNNAELSMQGTIFWMAPEVLDSIVENKKRGYSAKVDIWSLGCVVLEMFAGKRPWSNEAVVSAIYKIGKTKMAPPIPEDIEQLMSNNAKNFIERCFSIDADKRPTAKELLSHPFVQVDSSFSFSETKLGKLIKYHSKKNIFK